MENAIQRFLRNLGDERGCAKNTIQAYRIDLEQLKTFLEAGETQTVTLDLIQPNSLTKFIRWLEQQGYQPSTISRKIAVARSFLGYLGRQDEFDPQRSMTVLHIPPNPKQPPRVLTGEEVTALLQSPTQSEHPRARRDRAILEFLFATGFRATEVVGLDVEDIDLTQGIVFRPPTQDRFVSLGLAKGSMLDYLHKGRPHLVRDPRVRALFLNQRGQPLSRQGLWLVVKRWAEAAGVTGSVSPQTLRHTLAQKLLDEGKSRKEVLELLDLSSPNSLWFSRSAKRST